MGYILPIHNFQAQYYQERITRKEQDQIPVDRIYPKRIETSHDVLLNHRMQHSQRDMSISDFSDQRSQPQASVSDYETPIYAELTGIGGKVNRYV